MKDKKYIDEKYADDILILAHKYINENPDKKGTARYKRMQKTLGTMDKYWAYINRMGFSMYADSIRVMADYAAGLPAWQGDRVAEYMKALMANVTNLR